MLYRVKFSAVLFLVVLFALCIAQMLADAYSGNMSANSGTERDSDIKKEFSIFIEIGDKTLYLLENGKCIKEYTIASGKSGSPSPIGAWKIVEKGDWGEGFGGRWMGLDVPWGTFQSGLY